ncbi:type III effector protein [Ralstonia sp. A12]|uniref:type III effector protein n=1 Tax=Ralstonia sp. A12 TaxID=1217052 RepID=UPI0005739C8C|nr:type III effector protein [Ralstonia sp. A12]KHK49862.1 type III effector protein [Ralstonia sp. A12]
MSLSPALSADALIERIRLSIQQAGKVVGIAARHEVFYQVAQTLRAEILAFAAGERDDEVVMRCVRAFHEQSFAFKHTHAIARLPYSPDIDRRYPFRNELNQPIVIATLEGGGQLAGSPRRYQAETVWPYLRAEATPDTRGALYHDTLLCRPLGLGDLRDAREQALVGERGVFAVREIAAGECVGVYGGRLMTPATYYTCIDDAFVLSASAGSVESWIDGENILAMANTVFAYEGDRPDRQAASGYNMEAAVFPGGSRCGRRFSIRAFFATECVAAGTELRWNYRYPPALIQQRFGSQPA